MRLRAGPHSRSRSGARRRQRGSPGRRLARDRKKAETSGDVDRKFHHYGQRPHVIKAPLLADARQTNSRRVAPPFEGAPREPQVIVSAAARARTAASTSEVRVPSSVFAAWICAPPPAPHRERARRLSFLEPGHLKGELAPCASLCTGAAPRAAHAPRSPCARRGSARRGGPAHCAAPLTVASG